MHTDRKVTKGRKRLGDVWLAVGMQQAGLVSTYNAACTFYIWCNCRGPTVPYNWGTPPYTKPSRGCEELLEYP